MFPSGRCFILSKDGERYINRRFATGWLLHCDFIDRWSIGTPHIKRRGYQAAGSDRIHRSTYLISASVGVNLGPELSWTSWITAAYYKFKTKRVEPSKLIQNSGYCTSITIQQCELFERTSKSMTIPSRSRNNNKRRWKCGISFSVRRSGFWRDS